MSGSPSGGRAARTAKTKDGDGYVPLHLRLARYLQAWRARTPYGKDADFAFPSLKTDGKVPLSRGIFVADYLRKAAIKAGC